MSEYAAIDPRRRDPVVAFVKPEPSPRWTMHTVMLATLIGIGIGLGFLLLYRFYMVVFLFFVAFSLATAMKPMVEWLQKRHIPLLLGIVPLYLALMGLVVGLLWFIAPIVLTQLMVMIRDLPQYYAGLRLSIQNSPNDLLQAVGSILPLELSLPANQLLPAATPAMGETTDVVTDPIGLLGQVVGNTSKILFMVIGVLLLAYYWLIEGDVIMRRLVLRTRLEQREAVRTFVAEVEGKIGGYFRGQLLLCFIIGLLSLVAFLLIGVPNALTLAFVSGITEAIPILGPTLGAVPAILLTLSTDPEKTIWVILALVLIQSVENNFLVPRVMDRSVGVHPLITILAIAAFGLLFGFVGAVLAIPLAAILQILLNRLLFRTITAEETAAAPAVGSQMRNRFAVLRLEAQELAQDVRKQARHNAPHQVHDAQIEQAEDMIETVASNLESYLRQRERVQ
ncbi:MAG: AI-2E family transporter [Caldilineaceae bacterium]